MIPTQIQLTDEQARALKRLAAKEGKSVAELIRVSVDNLIRRSGNTGPEELHQHALNASGKLNGLENLATDHDAYLAEALDQ
jgi:16S rRNA U516 pseudouridylate synthase RsuA-like enzyme